MLTYENTKCSEAIPCFTMTRCSYTEAVAIGHGEAAGISIVTFSKLMTYCFGLRCNIQYGEN